MVKVKKPSKIKKNSQEDFEEELVKIQSDTFRNIRLQASKRKTKWH